MMKILVNVSYTHSAFLFFFKKAVSYWYNIDKLTDGTFSHQFSSDAQSCLTICDPMDCSMQGFPVHLQLPKLAQTHIHQVGDAIQPSCPLSSPSPPVFNLSQHQCCAVLCLVTQWWPTLCDPMDCSMPGSSVHGILQARILELVAMPSSRGSSQPRDQTRVSCTAGRFFTIWAIGEAGDSYTW